jgi:hypothetical protein
MDITELKRNKAQNRHPWELARVKIIKALVRKYHSSCSHILDIGSGDSFVLKSLCADRIANSYTAVDIAYTPEVIKTINDANTNNISYLHEIPGKLEPKSDCVLLLDVLEHCQDDGKLLEQIINNNLTVSPFLFITVPAFQNLFSQHDELLYHYRRYTVKTISTLCTERQLQIVAKGYFFMTLLIIRGIQLFLEKLALHKPKKSIDNWKAGSLISKVITSFLWFDFLIGRLFLKLGIQIPGLSVYCICRLSPS